MGEVSASGVTSALAAIFSTGQRKQLLPFASQMWTDASQLLSSRTAASSVIARKLATKLVQRIGLTFLPATVAAWRYQQTSVSINASLSNIGSGTAGVQSVPAQPDTSNTSVVAAAQQHQSSAGAPVLTKNDSTRPALQPSLLVNASPVTSPSNRACTHASDRQHAYHQEDQTARSNLPEQSTIHAAASDRQDPGAEAAQMSHEQDVSGASVDGDFDEDIPEEIEEVCSTILCPQ